MCGPCNKHGTPHTYEQHKTLQQSAQSELTLYKQYLSKGWTDTSQGQTWPRLLGSDVRFRLGFSLGTEDDVEDEEVSATGRPIGRLSVLASLLMPSSPTSAHASASW